MRRALLRTDLLEYVSKTEFKILEILSESPTGLSVKEIAALLRSPSKYLYFVLSYLACNGWVEVKKHHDGKNAGRPRNVYVLSKSLDEILEELHELYSSSTKRVDLTNCKRPFHVVKIKRIAKIARYRDLVQVLVDEEDLGDVIDVAVSKGLKVKECKRNGDVYEITFRKV